MIQSAEILSEKYGTLDQNGKRELFLFLKKGLRRLATLDGLENKPIEELARELLTFLPSGGRIYCQENPLYLKHLTAETLFSAWGMEAGSKEALLIQSWIKAGILQHIAFPEPVIKPQPLPLPEGFLNPPDYEDTIRELLETNSLWRLFVGADLQAVETPKDYENRQPGVLKAMENALYFALNTLDKPLDSTILNNIHLACVENVKGLNSLKTKYHSSSYRDKDEEVGFGISMEGNDYNLSVAGYREVCLSPAAGKHYYVNPKRITAMLYGKELVAEIDILLTLYNKKMSQEKDKKKQLILMLETFSHLERIHPFWDANCRSICVIGLLRELIKYKFSLVILNNPNRLDGLSTIETLNELILGYYNLQKILDKNKEEEKEDEEHKFHKRKRNR